MKLNVGTFLCGDEADVSKISRVVAFLIKARSFVEIIPFLFNSSICIYQDSDFMAGIGRIDVL